MNALTLRYTGQTGADVMVKGKGDEILFQGFVPANGEFAFTGSGVSTTMTGAVSS